MLESTDISQLQEMVQYKANGKRRVPHVEGFSLTTHACIYLERGCYCLLDQSNMFLPVRSWRYVKVEQKE